MRNAPIVPGVPTQYVYQNRVWPSRFHGPIYTRPVFGMPKITAPFDVFTASYNVDRELPQPTLSGLGATVGEGPLWDTGEGVFRPGGYGGGVFDGNISGLGSIGQRTAPRKAIGADDDDMPWRVKTNTTIELQSTVNALLLGMGMCPIEVDGKLGGATCGAAKYVLQQKGGSAAISEEMPTACNTHQAEWVAPRKNTGNCGGGVPAPSPNTSSLPSPVLQSGMSSSSKRALGFALGGALAIGAVVMLRKKR